MTNEMKMEAAWVEEEPQENRETLSELTDKFRCILKVCKRSFDDKKKLAEHLLREHGFGFNS